MRRDVGASCGRPPVRRGAPGGNPVALALIDTYGTPGVGLVNFSALVVVVLLWATLPDRYATAVLSAFALVSLAVVGVNTVTLAAL